MGNCGCLAATGTREYRDDIDWAQQPGSETQAWAAIVNCCTNMKLGYGSIS
jgi:hypothetical protein